MALDLPGGLTLDELKMVADKKLSADDALLEFYLESAFEQAQAAPPYGCGRTLTPDPAAAEEPPVQKTIPAVGRRVFVPDAREITAVLADDVAIDAADLDIYEHQGHIVRIDVPRECRTARVTGRFGFLRIPTSLRQAIYTLAVRAYHERSAQFADQVVIAEGAGVQTYYRQLPPATKLVFGTFAVPAAYAGLA